MCIKLLEEPNVSFDARRPASLSHSVCHCKSTLREYICHVSQNKWCMILCTCVHGWAGGRVSGTEWNERRIEYIFAHIKHIEWKASRWPAIMMIRVVRVEECTIPYADSVGDDGIVYNSGTTDYGCRFRDALRLWYEGEECSTAQRVQF